MRSILNIDPFGTYNLEDLLKVSINKPPKDFDTFWQEAYRHILTLNPQANVQDTGEVHSHWKILRVSFVSTNSVTICGWLLVPKQGEVKRAFVVGHGYAGREGPDFDLPFPDAVIFFPCSRGISLSAVAPYSQDPYWHVIHDIDKKQQYIIRGCVEDVWLSVSVLENLYPQLVGKIGLLGISFSGGVGTLALAQDTRIAKAHFNVPTFGHYNLRLRIATHGSGKSIQDFFKREPFTLLRTLRYYDAAYAAENIKVPVHMALALRDSVVTPPGQFAIFNQVKSKKHLYLLEAGHDSYPNQAQQNTELKQELATFFDM